jgi:hypothetical protein
MRWLQWTALRAGCVALFVVATQDTAGQSALEPAAGAKAHELVFSTYLGGSNGVIQASGPLPTAATLPSAGEMATVGWPSSGRCRGNANVGHEPKVIQFRPRTRAPCRRVHRAIPGLRSGAPATRQRTGFVGPGRIRPAGEGREGGKILRTGSESAMLTGCSGLNAATQRPILPLAGRGNVGSVPAIPGERKRHLPRGESRS